MKKYFKLQSRWVLIAVVVTLIQSIARVSEALIGTYALNSLVQGKMKKFIFFILLQLVAWIITAIFVYLMYKYQEVAAQKMSQSLRIDISQKIAQQSYENFHKKDTGDYVSWLSNDVNIIEDAAFKSIFSFFTIISDSIISILALLAFHWSIVIVSIFLSFLSVLAIKVTQKKLKEQNLEISNANERLIAVITDLLRGFDTLLAFNLPKKIVEATKKQGDQLLEKQVNFAQTKGLTQAIATLCNAGGYLLTQAWIGILIILKMLPIGAIISAGNLASTIFNDFSQIGPALNEILSTEPLFAKYQLPSQDTAKGEISTSSKPAIIVDNLSYSYPNSKKTALKDITMYIPFNDKVVLLGESGCGKSTFMNILSGKLTGYHGSIKIGAQELSALAPKAVKQEITYIDQIPYIFSGSIRDNLTLGEHFSDKQLHHALKQSDLDDFVNSQKQGLDTPVGEAGQLFSGGQRQRLALARGLLRHPKVLLIDEGTNSLSKTSAIKIEKLFLSLPNLTVIFVTHQIHEEISQLFDQRIKF